MSIVKSIIEKSCKAAEQYATFTQEQVDKIFYEAAKAGNEARIPLAVMAVEETRMGVVEDKVIKNHFASEIIYNKWAKMQTVGTYCEDDGLGIEKIYEPVGIVGAIIPTTNPTSTAIFKILLALKTRNSIVLAPHPRAWKCTTEAARILLDAAIKAGAPENIIQWLPQNGTMDDTTELMHSVNLILATGGAGLVKAAYSSGTPAIGVGAGNCPAVFDSSCDIKLAVSSVIQSNMFDNGVVCATENALVIVKDIYDKVLKEFENQGAYIVSDKKDIANVKKYMFKENKFGLLNPDVVGQTPQRLGEIFKIKVPEWAKIMLVIADSWKHEDPLSHEKLSTFVSVYKANDFNQAIEIQKELIKLGPGHTSSIFINECEKEKINLYKSQINSGRLIVNMPSSVGAVGDLYNFGLSPTLTIGCGTWGGNIFSENIEPKHLLNIKTLAKRRENMLWMKIPRKVYFKYGCTPSAFKDFASENIKKIFIVTDNVIWNFYGKKITSYLEANKIDYRVFTDVEPNPSIKTCKTGAKLIEAYKPDAILGFGGGSSLDAAKIMWLFYEEPDAKFADLAMCFADIMKRIVKYPNLGSKAKMISMPTTSGTGSEVTPFAVITDEKTDIKYPLADYSLTPTIAIIDGEYMMNLPAKLTAATGMDALTHAIEAYVAVLATEFTDPYALEAITTIFKYLPRAVKNGQNDKEAREKMAHAASIAGIAFANAFLGIVHSLSHKIGGHLHVIHGNANAIYLPYVIKYNAASKERERQTYFSQFTSPWSKERYAKIADALNLGGKNADEKVQLLINAIHNLSVEIGVPTSTKEYGVKDEDLEKIVDQMAVEAFDDQCTGANPRIPSFADLKQIYLDAHYGKDIFKAIKK